MNNQKIYNKILDIIYKSDINITLYKNRILSKNFLNNKELKSIYLHIIEQCNLNCAYCDNFSPLAKDNWYISIEQFENNIKRLKFFFNNISFINIGGGESLLHPYIIEFCYILRNYYPYSNINILTNGLLLEKEYDNKNFILYIVN